VEERVEEEEQLIQKKVKVTNSSVGSQNGEGKFTFVISRATLPLIIDKWRRISRRKILNFIVFDIFF
jgi:hypothetical protein